MILFEQIMFQIDELSMTLELGEKWHIKHEKSILNIHTYKFM